jgi:predicted RNA-binding protein with PUA domain
MKIVICGSMIFSKKMLEIKCMLEKSGHIIVVPEDTEKYAEIGYSDKETGESVANKIKGDLIRDYYNKIKDSDAVLIINETKNNLVGYIGGNSFLEMAFGHVLNKKVFILNELPEKSQYIDEIIAIQPIILNGNLDKIK